MALTIKYIQDNDDIIDAGYDLSEKISTFVDDAAEADYKCEDGEQLQLAVDEFWDDANKHPDSIRDVFDSYKCTTIREIVLTLFSPYSYLEPWRRNELKEALTSSLNKKQLVDALIQYGTAANEFFRLLWLVKEHGGWAKEEKNNG